jgi:hypothetical protein
VGFRRHLLAIAGLSLLGWSACSSSPPGQRAQTLPSGAPRPLIAPLVRKAAPGPAHGEATALPTVPVPAPPPKRKPPERPPTSEPVHFVIHFLGLQVDSDAEMGSGDWRVSVEVDGKPIVTKLMGEVDVGTLMFDAEACSSGPEDSHRIAIDVVVDELDSYAWDAAGSRQERLGYSEWFGEGEGWILLDTSEGTVRLLYEIRKGTCPAALRTPAKDPTYQCQTRCRTRLEGCGASSDLVDGNCLRLCERSGREETLDCLDGRPCDNMVEMGGRGETEVCSRRGNTRPRKCSAQSDCARGDVNGWDSPDFAWHVSKPSAASSNNAGGGDAVDEACSEPADGKGGVGDECHMVEDCRWHRACSCPKGKSACVAQSFWARACVDAQCAGADEACALAIDESQYLGAGGPLCSP